jgi:four helix bundle protein
MTPEMMKRRTKEFALPVLRVVDSLPKRFVAVHMGGQLARCGTSVASNYRAACRARSKKEFCSKLGIVEEEADESVFWMEMLVEAKIVKGSLLGNLIQEGNEILAIVVASIRTARHS